MKKIIKKNNYSNHFYYLVSFTKLSIFIETRGNVNTTNIVVFGPKFGVFFKIIIKFLFLRQNVTV